MAGLPATTASCCSPTLASPQTGRRRTCQGPSRYGPRRALRDGLRSLKNLKRADDCSSSNRCELLRRWLQITQASAMALSSVRGLGALWLGRRRLVLLDMSVDAPAEDGPA